MQLLFYFYLHLILHAFVQTSDVISGNFLDDELNNVRRIGLLITTDLGFESISTLWSIYVDVVLTCGQSTLKKNMWPNRLWDKNTESAALQFFP
jgi:hypothetical protein